MFFLQMSGFPGSGKSTLSRLIAKKTGAIIVDHDIVKSALLHSLEGTPIDAKLAGKISYQVDWSLIEFHLSQGLRVILDSPCLYQELIEKGMALSEKYHVKYKYVECYLNDFHEVNLRLRNRESMVSQLSEISSEENFKYSLENTKRPADHPYLVVDTSEPLESYIHDVINYIKE